MALNSLCGFFVPIENLRAVPRRYPRSAQDLFKSTPDMANSVRHTRQIAVHGDRHNFWTFDGFRVEAFKMIHHTLIHLVGGMALEHHHHDVMKFKIIGQGDDGLVRSPQRHWLIIEYPVADVLKT